jgi:hypothetical protein
LPDSRIIPSLSGYYKEDFGRGAYRYGRTSFWAAGQASYIQPPAQNEDTFVVLQNTMPVTDGRLETRWGYTPFGTAQTAQVRRLFHYYNNDTDTRGIMGVCPATAPFVFGLTETGTSLLTATALPAANEAASENLYAVCSRNYLYLIDGEAADQQKWISGGVFSKWGIDAPTTAISVGSPTAGAITLESGRAYFAVFYNSTTGHHSDLSPVSASTGALNAQEVPLSNIPVSSDPQVTNVRILATADGGDQTVLYGLALIANGTTTYTDNTDEQSLLLLDVYQDTDEYGNLHGVAENTPPPTNSGICISHAGRLWILDGNALYFSKNLDDVTTASGLITGRYEEAWPGTYQMQISKDAENGTALYSDGVTLYIGTSRAVWRLTGDSPLNFSEPQVIYNETGVVNQDVMRRVFVEGQPVGGMWLTPDNRVILSNFNTYEDVGTPIQDVLNSINAAARTTCYASFVSANAFDLYLLAIPTGTATQPNQMVVFNCRTKQWSVWNLANTALNAVFFTIPDGGAPLWLFTDNIGNIFQFQSTATTDNGTAIAGAATTAWQALGDPQLRKFVNDIELVASSGALSATVNGASDIAHFDTPNVVASGVAPVQSLFGQWKLMLAAYPTVDRLYQLALTWTGPISFGGWNFETVPIDRF